MNFLKFMVKPRVTFHFLDIIIILFSVAIMQHNYIAGFIFLTVSALISVIIERKFFEISEKDVDSEVNKP